MKGHDIGRGLTLVNRFFRSTEEDEEFSRAMGAPMGELRHIINKGNARGFRRLRRQVKAITGLKWRVFEEEVKRRTSYRYCHFQTHLYDYGQWHGQPIRASWLMRQGY